MEIDPHKYPGPLEDLEKKQIPNKSNEGATEPNKLVGIIVALFVLGLGALFYILFITNADLGDIEEWGFISAIPFWLIFIIPFFGKKKDIKKDARTQAMKIILIVSIISIFIAGLGVFLLAENM